MEKIINFVLMATMVLFSLSALFGWMWLYVEYTEGMSFFSVAMAGLLFFIRAITVGVLSRVIP